MARRKHTTVNASNKEGTYCYLDRNYDAVSHDHDFFEFMIVTEGEGLNVYKKGIEVLCSKGTLALLRPKDVHAVRKISDNFVHDDLYISIDKMEKLCNGIHPNFYSDLLALKKPIIINLDFYRLKAFRDELSTLFSSTESDKNLDIEHSFLVLELLKHVFNRYFVEHETQMPKWINEIKEKISNPQTFILPLADLFDGFFYSRAYISIMFKKYMNQTVAEYRNYIRVKYSISMLEENNMSINKIAGVLGWDNPNNYIISFKRIYGITPLQYRNKNFKR